MLKAVFLLFSVIASIDSGVVRRTNAEDQTLREIINALMHISKGQISKAACHETMVPDIFSDKTHQNPSETFCKAAKALKNITPCRSIQHDMKKLNVNLLKAGDKASTCTVDNNFVIQLVPFLNHLMKFSKKIYRQ